MELMETNKNDLELVISYKNGNKNSLEKLYIKYKRSLLRIIWYYVNNLEDAEDVLQMLFLKLIDSIKKYKIYKDVKFRTWLYRVAINTAKDFLKKKKCKLNIDFNVDIIDNRMDVIENLENKEVVIKVRNSIFQLPDKYKELITLIYFENLRYEDVAKILNKPVGTIKSRCNYALNLLRKKMGVFYK